MIVPNVIGPAYTSQSPVADAEACVNLYPEKMESPGAKNALVYYPCPGVETFCTLPLTGNRGLYTNNGRTFAVNSTNLYELFADGSYTDWGAMAADASPVTMCSNGDAGHQLFIVTGGQGYIFDLNTNTLTSVLVGASQAGFLNGYFAALDATTATLKISDLEDGTTWDPLAVAQRNTAADRWVAVAVLHGEIWLFGQQTGEVWYDAGSTPMPMAPIAGAFFEYGIAANFSLARLGRTVCWLSRNEQGQAVVMQSQGYVPMRISTHAIEFAIQGYDRIDDAEGDTYQDQGHEFYVLSFPSAGVTWVYDTTTGLWHQRGYWDTSTAAYDVTTASHHCFAFDQHLVGSRDTGVIYRQSIDVHTDRGGAPLRWLRRFPHLSQEQQWITYDALQIDMQVGLGATDPATTEPTILLRYSNDQGLTWSDYRAAQVGQLGDYLRRVRFLRLGRGRDRVFELSGSADIPWRIVNAYLQITPGTN